MSTMHGIEAIRIMRTDLDYKGPIIGVTGATQEEEIATLLSAGADTVVMKPLTLEKLEFELKRLDIC